MGQVTSYTKTKIDQLIAANGGDGSVSSDYINIVDLGAVGDGATDNTIALQEARNLAGVNGKVYVPAGVFLTRGLPLTLDGQTWHLAANGVIKAAPGLVNDLHTVLITGNRVTIEGKGEIDGNSSGQTQAANDAVRVNAHDCTFREFTIRNAHRYGLALLGSRNKAFGVKVINSKLTGIIHGPQYGSGIDVSDCEVIGCFVDRTGLDAATIGESGIKAIGNSGAGKALRARFIGNVVLHPESPTNHSLCIEAIYAEGTVVDGNITVGGSMGISIAASALCAVNGNVVKRPKNLGIEVAGSSYTTVTGNTVDGRLSSGAWLATGIVVNPNAVPCVGVTVESNTILHVSSYGVAINGSVGCSVIGNSVVLVNNAFSAGVWCNVTHHVSITGNTIDGAAALIGTGIRIQNSTDVIANGNNLGNNLNQNVTVIGSNPIVLDRIIVTANIFAFGRGGVGTEVSGGASLGVVLLFTGNSNEAATADPEIDYIKAALGLGNWRGDTFNRPDAAVLGVMSCGIPWADVPTGSGGPDAVDLGVSGQRMIGVSGLNPTIQRPMRRFDLGYANGRAKFRGFGQVGSARHMIIIRAADTSNYIRVGIAADFWGIEKIVNNVVTTLAVVNLAQPTIRKDFEVRWNGSTITTFINGFASVQATDPSLAGTLLTDTHVGVFSDEAVANISEVAFLPTIP